ncbi:MAG: hypothetical protein HY711_03800 [Candidatus Melainabacteria bacterium]|nr:hypothetical protein [Candidatus Melainabacteria bacterium]
MNKIRLTVAVLVLAVYCCIASPISAAGPAQNRVYQTPPVSIGKVLFGQVQPAQQVDPQKFYHKVWQLVKDNFLYQGRLSDWNKWEHKYDGRLTTFADAERAIYDMLDSLGDDYTFYKNRVMTKAEAQEDDEKNVVSYKMLPGNIGYIKIATFGSKHTSDEVKAALTSLSSADAYVLDLRDNGGGYVLEALKIFSLFVDQGKFTSLKGYYEGKPYDEEVTVTATEIEDNENGKITKAAREPNMTGNKPVIVLVNGDSASASEMLSGALRDNKRAELLGTQTYGKGIAQNTFELDGGTSMQITFARFYPPCGSNFHGVGLTPTYVVKQPLGRQDVQFQEAVKVLLKKLGR